MAEISFATNWNKKLDCDVFPTYRILGPKYKIGQFYKIKLKKGKEFVDYKMIQIIDIHPLPLAKVTNTQALLDTGYPLSEFIEIVKTMYGKDKNKKEQDVYALPFAWIICKTVKSAFND